MKTLCTLVLMYICLGSFAQPIQLKGTVKNGNRQPVEFANIVLQTADSVMVTGTTSNLKGHFELNGINAGTYRLLISSMGYRTQEIWLNDLSQSRDLGNIPLEEESFAIDNVTVTASTQRSEVDRKIVYPSARQQKASANGVDLLQQLMLPRIQVDPVNNTIKVPGDGEVQMRINGVKVTAQEIRALRPDEIVRVEYHDNPGLRYGNAEIVIDYIVRRPETGGSFGIDIMQSPHVGWGNYQASMKINHKKSEFSANFWGGPRNFYGVYRDNLEDFNLENGTELHRYEKGVPSHWKMMQQWLNVAYNLQDNNKYQLNISVNYSGNNSPIQRYHGQLINRTDETDYVDMTDETNSNRHTPSIDIYYQRNLKKNQVLIFDVVGTCNKEFSDRTYQESRDNVLLADVQNTVYGKKYSLIGEGIYEKKLANGMRWGAGIRHTHSFSNNDYLNGHNYHTRMQQGSTYLYGEVRGKAKRLDYMLGIGGTRSFYRQEGSVDLYQYYTFNPRLTLKYTFNDRSYLRLRSSISNEMPSLGNLSAIDQVIDSLQIQRGNPNLEAYLHYSNTLDGEWSSGIFYTYFSVAYNYKPHAIMDEKYVEGNKIIQTWDNQKSWQRIAPMIQLRVGPVADILQFSVSGGLNHFISRGNTYHHKYSNWWLDASVSASWKNFNFMYQIMTNQNWFSGETLKGGENAQIIMLNYKWKDLQIGAGMFNPFTNDYKTQQENWNRYASSRKTNYIQESAQMAFLTLSYSFSFGRHYKSANKKISNQDSDSGIMQTGK